MTDRTTYRKLWGDCPGCGQRVELLRPRDKGTKGGRLALPWRRKSHYLRRGGGRNRCRHETFLQDHEIPREDP